MKIQIAIKNILSTKLALFLFDWILLVISWDQIQRLNFSCDQFYFGFISKPLIVFLIHNCYQEGRIWN